MCSSASEGLSNANPIRALLRAGLAKSFSQARRLSVQMDGKTIEKAVARVEERRKAGQPKDSKHGNKR